MERVNYCAPAPVIFIEGTKFPSDGQMHIQNLLKAATSLCSYQPGITKQDRPA